MAAKIIVIDDNKDFLYLMTWILSEEGYRVLTAQKSESAYKTVLVEQPDLLILDMRMEGPDTGVLLLERILLDPATAAIPVIICSADIVALRGNHKYLMSKGCSIVEKPFEIADLLAAVERCLSTSVPLSAATL